MPVWVRSRNLWASQNAFECLFMAISGSPGDGQLMSASGQKTDGVFESKTMKNILLLGWNSIFDSLSLIHAACIEAGKHAIGHWESGRSARLFEAGRRRRDRFSGCDRWNKADCGQNQACLFVL